MTPTEHLEKEIAETTGWRGEAYQQLVDIVKSTAPSLTLNWKWNSAIWSGKKDVLSVSPFKEHVKINFFKGAALTDCQAVFNNGLAAKNSRSIDFHSTTEIDPAVIKQVIKATVAYDQQ